MVDTDLVIADRSGPSHLDGTPSRADQGAVGVYRRFGKRLFDVIFASLALVLVAPIIMVFAVLNKIEGGPAFFGHTRIGANGKPFKCWKIRTMVPDAEARLQTLLDTDEAARAQWERDFKLDNDPRITSRGHFLRKSSVDELPQFWNVLRGDMSVVGPRPIVSDEISLYGRRATKVFSVKPGVTGLWQVSGRNDIDYSRRIRLDALYVRRMSLFLDLSIIGQTILTVLKRSGR
ncbi:sugar transferase [Salibaculum halophilum]|uniref:sugar transferase n=1 Tax=Salibaculum halophilum TaxID=1914408 RepID=UPI000A0FCDF7|nr:sugar transferase [Salibaculum halophilum]